MMAAYTPNRASASAIPPSIEYRIPDDARKHEHDADDDDDVYERPGVTVGDHLCHAPAIVAGP
jgi:hypothetical protein